MHCNTIRELLRMPRKEALALLSDLRLHEIKRLSKLCTELRKVNYPRKREVESRYSDVHRAFSCEQLIYVLSSIKSDVDFFACLTIFFFGLRPCELSKARFQGGMLLVPMSKVDRVKSVPVPNCLKPVLDRLSDYQGVSPSGLRNRFRRRLKALGGMYSRYCVDKAGKTRNSLTLYSLRHTAATILYDYCKDERIVMKLLGHAKAGKSVTFKYLHVTPSELLEHLEKAFIPVLQAVFVRRRDMLEEQPRLY